MCLPVSVSRNRLGREPRHGACASAKRARFTRRSAAIGPPMRCRERETFRANDVDRDEAPPASERLAFQWKRRPAISAVIPGPPISALPEIGASRPKSANTSGSRE